MSYSALNQIYNQYPRMFDEMYDREGNIRKVYQRFSKLLKKLTIEDLNNMNEFSKDFFMNQGVTFTVYSDDQGVEKIFPFDIIPRIIENNEWKLIEEGLKQRLKALNLFIKDIYHEQFFLRDNMIPAELIVANPNYLRIMRGLKVPEDIYTHISGIDLIRNESGKFFVLEDNLELPLALVIC